MKLFENGIDITDAEVLALKNDLTDIEQWVLEALAGKISHAKNKMLNEGLPKLMADSNRDSIPSKMDSILDEISKMPDYKNREQRDADLKGAVNNG